MSYQKEEIQKVLDDIMVADFQQRSERASSIIKILDACPDNEQSAMLAYVLQWFKTDEPSGEVMTDKRISDSSYREIVDCIGGDVYRIFRLWLKKNPSEEDLAHKIWCFLRDNLKDDDKRNVALSLILFDEHIPYRQIPDEPDLDFDFGDFQKAFGGEGEKTLKELKQDGVLVQNILRRRGISRDTSALLWSIVNRQEPEVLRYAMFDFILHLLEDEVKNDVRNDINESIFRFFRNLR